MPPATFDETTVDITAGDYIVPRQGHRAEVRRLDGGLQPGSGSQPPSSEPTRSPSATDDGVHGETDEERHGVAAAARRRRSPGAEGAAVPSRSSRSRRRASPKRRSSRSSKRTASAGRAPTRRSSACSRIAITPNKIDGRVQADGARRDASSDLLAPAFDDILDVDYTRELEEDLDKIEEGKTNYEKTLDDFYKKFKKDSEARRQGDAAISRKGIEPDPASRVRQVRRADGDQSVGKFGLFLACSALSRVRRTRASSRRRSRSAERRGIEIEPCENCGKPMVVKRGRFGQFLACTGYPECKTTRKMIATKQGGLTAAKPDQILDEKCPKLRRRTSSSSRAASASSRRARNYPECKYVKQKTTGVICPKERQGRRHRRAEVAARQGVLRLRELSGLRLRAVEPADRREVPEVRRAVPRREDHQAARPSAAVQQRGLRLRAQSKSWPA